MIIRAAVLADVPMIFEMVKEHADYDHKPGAVSATEEDYREALFRPDARVRCHIVAEGIQPMGFALWFPNFSSWTGKSGMFLEDIYVREEFRRCGCGSALMRMLAGICVKEGYARFEWNVLNWNQTALSFYRSLGASELDEWKTCRITGSALTGLAQS